MSQQQNNLQADLYKKFGTSISSDVQNNIDSINTQISTIQNSLTSNSFVGEVLPLSGGTMTGDINLNYHNLTGINVVDATELIAKNTITIKNENAYDNGDVQGEINFKSKYWSNSDTLIGSNITSYKSANDGNAGTDLAFSVVDSGNNVSEVIRINNQGNVGIGTDTPTQKLDVNGDVNFDRAIVAKANGGLITFGYDKDNASGVFGGFDGTTVHGAYFQLFGKGSSGTGATPPGGGEFIINSSNNPTKFTIGVYDGSSWTTKLVVNSDGNLGINATDPTRRLEVIGDAYINGPLNVDNVIYDNIGSSINWNSVYSVVNSNSANWDLVGTDNNIGSLTGNWQNTFNTFATQSANNLSVFSTVNSNSATWVLGGNSADSVVRSLTAKWESTYSTVNTSSANNLSNYTTVNSNSANWNYQGNDVKTLTGNWQSVYTTVNNQSANNLSNYTTVNSNSANWNQKAYLPLSGGSMNGNILLGNNIISDSNGNNTDWNSVYSTVKSNSATTWNYQGTDVKSLTSNWQSVYTTVNNQSANNLSNYSTVNSNSANWQSVYSSFNSQSANNTSVYSIVNSNSALNWNYQGTDIKSLTSNWQETFTNFSAQSANNLSNYTTVSSNSANWNYQGTDIKSLTSNWQETFTNFGVQSANNLSNYTTVNSNSANWNSVYSTVNSQSANNLSNYTTVNSNSANWNYQGTDVKSLTSNWQNTFTNFSVQSANNLSNYTNNNTYSANWNSVYSTVNSQSANNLSNYTTVNSNSALWSAGGAGGMDIGVRALTSNWQNSYTTVNVNSALWVNSTYGEVWIDAGAMLATTLSGAVSQTVPITASNNEIYQDCFVFDPAAIKYAQFKIALPANTDKNNIKAKFYWSNETTAANGSVVWNIQSISYSVSSLIDLSWGTAQAVTDSLSANSVMQISPSTLSIVPAGTLSNDSLLLFRVSRNASAAADTLAVNTRLFGIKLQYPISGSLSSTW